MVTVDIPSAAANTFANSQYDTNAIPKWPNAALDHQRVDVVTPLLEMHGPIRFTSSQPPELCLLACDKEPANLRRRYCSGSNVVMLRPSCPNSTRRCEALMSAWGHSRHFGRRPTTSGLPLETDIVRAGRHVSKVPILLQKSVETGGEA